jgi:hypothetical protein
MYTNVQCMFTLCPMYNQCYRASQVVFERADSVSFGKYGAYVLRIGMHLIAEGSRMKIGRPKSALVLTADEDGTVAELGDSSLNPPASGRMRGMSLLSHVGLGNAAIAEKLDAGVGLTE